MTFHISMIISWKQRFDYYGYNFLERYVMHDILSLSWARRPKEGRGEVVLDTRWFCRLTLSKLKTALTIASSKIWFTIVEILITEY